MFGKMLSIDNNIVTIENTEKNIESALLNFHVTFIEKDRKVIGEIININENFFTINLIGEIVDDNFYTGIVQKPSFKTSCRIITKHELECLIGKQDISATDTLLIGHSLKYDNYVVTVNKNDFFSNHFAILGNTGSGKSCGVAKIIQNLFYYNDSKLPLNSHIVIFDVYGEYNRSFQNFNNVPGIGYKYYTSDTSALIESNNIKIPPYLLSVDDLALLLNVDDPTIIPTIADTLRLVYIFTSKDPNIEVYQNNIIAKSLEDILSSGKAPSQIRDQVIAVLTKYHTNRLNLSSIIHQPGYDRTIKQCLNIDAQGKINAITLVVDFLTQFTNVDLNQININNNFYYNLDNIYYALEFALMNEGILSSNKAFEKLNTLKVRLKSIIDSPIKKVFEVNNEITKEDFVHDFFTKNGTSPVQIVDVDLKYFEERFAKSLTKILAKLFFNFETNVMPRASFPIHLIIEEAHRYVQNDNDLEVLGYNIFDRITKEGRKYGMILGLITQRPSELSLTALSQCSNFIVFRMIYPDDIKLVASISSKTTDDQFENIKSLRPGLALCFGTAFRISTMVRFDLPEPMPESNSVDIVKIWY